jgi:DNA-binding protein H-NS
MLIYAGRKLNLDLNSLTLKELKELQSQVSKAVGSFEERKRKEALSELEEKAKALGFSLADLVGTNVARKRTPAVAKFANPDDPNDKWSGRGRKPRWFAEALDAGRNPADFAI